MRALHSDRRGGADGTERLVSSGVCCLAVRDLYLMPHAWGCAFVRFYYSYSPPVVDYIRERPWARAMVRAVLAPFVLVAGWLVTWRSWDLSLQHDAREASESMEPLVSRRSRRLRDFRRCSPANQIELSTAPPSLRSESSSRRSGCFRNLQRHSCGIEQSGSGSRGAATARVLLPFRDFTAAQQLPAVTIVTAA